MQKDKRERYLELLAGLRLMDDDFFSEALDEKIAPVEYILNTVLERDDIRVLRTEAQVEYKSAANRSIKLDIRAVDAEGRVMDIEDHQREAAEAPDLFQHLDRLVMPGVFKSVPLPERKEDIREHDNSHEAQTVRIKPLRRKHSLQSASGQETPSACRITL